jgi:hypothetical protein
MPLSYDESSSLMTDMAFRGRVKVAVLRFAAYIADEGPGTPAHNTRLRWANTAFQNPDAIAMQAQPITVMDPSVQDQGAAIPDDQLQGAVENALQKML